MNRFLPFAILILITVGCSQQKLASPRRAPNRSLHREGRNRGCFRRSSISTGERHAYVPAIALPSQRRSPPTSSKSASRPATT